MKWITQLWTPVSVWSSNFVNLSWIWLQTPWFYSNIIINFMLLHCVSGKYPYPHWGVLVWTGPHPLKIPVWLLTFLQKCCRLRSTPMRTSNEPLWEGMDIYTYFICSYIVKKVNTINKNVLNLWDKRLKEWIKGIWSLLWQHVAWHKANNIHLLCCTPIFFVHVCYRNV